MIRVGVQPCFFSSLRINFNAAVHPKRLHRNHQIEIRALNVTMPSGPLSDRMYFGNPHPRSKLFQESLVFGENQMRSLKNRESWIRFSIRRRILRKGVPKKVFMMPQPIVRTAVK